MESTRCNLCGGLEFGDMNKRPKVRCRTCGSLERTRLMQLFLERLQLVRPGIRVMHLAPEAGLSRKFIDAGAVYEAYDVNPNLYRHCKVKRMDLLECEKLPSRRYDLVVHSHVLEHVACNVTAVLYHLHRALNDAGTHIFAIPIHGGAYAEDLGPMDEQERVRRFKQNDHVRKFGCDDILRTLGMIFHIPPRYNLRDFFSSDQLKSINVPEAFWSGYTSNSIFCLRKADMKLVGV